MTKAMQVENGEFGPRLVVSSPWSDTYASYMAANSIKELSLNYTAGFQDNNVEFLRAVPFVQGLHFISYTVPDASPINDLHDLRYLHMGYVGKTVIDFEKLPKLESCTFWRIIKHTGLVTLRHLHSLSLMSCLDTDAKAIEQLDSLTSLTLNSSKLPSITWLSSLSDLIELNLAYFAELSNLHGIESLSKLQKLQLTACRKLSSIEAVSNLNSLRSLHILESGNIDSLKPVMGLENLESLVFYGSTNIVDGDLSVVDVLPRLSKVSFQNRKHYTHQRNLQTEKISQKN